MEKKNLSDCYIREILKTLSPEAWKGRNQHAGYRDLLSQTLSPEAWKGRNQHAGYRDLLSQTLSPEAWKGHASYLTSIILPVRFLPAADTL